MSGWTPPSLPEDKAVEKSSTWTPPNPSPANPSWAPPLPTLKKKNNVLIGFGVIGGIFILFVLIAGVTQLVKSDKNEPNQSASSSIFNLKKKFNDTTVNNDPKVSQSFEKNGVTVKVTQSSSRAKEVKYYSPSQLAGMNPTEIDSVNGQLYGDFIIVKFKGDQFKAFAVDDTARKIIYFFSWKAGVNSANFKEGYKISINKYFPALIQVVASQPGKTTVNAQLEIYPLVTAGVANPAESAETESVSATASPTYTYQPGRSNLYRQEDIRSLVGSSPKDSWVYGQFTITSRGSSQVTAHPAGAMTGNVAENVAVESLRQGLFGGRRSAPVRNTYRPTSYIFEIAEGVSLAGGGTLTIPSNRPAKIKRVSGYGNDVTVTAVLIYPSQ